LVRLIRARLSLMVSFSAVTGYFLTGSSQSVPLISLFGGVFLLASGASALNQVQERERDALMQRTTKRPIPAGGISAQAAFRLALLMIIGGTLLLCRNDWLPMALGLLNIVFYNLVYTPLKTRSWLAVLPGALVGAIPPLIGWTSAGFYIFHPNAVFISIFVFLWQVPHFWLLMVKYGKEYESAGFSSISNVLNQMQIKSAVFGWGVITSLFLMLFPLFGFILKPVLLAALIALNLLFITMFHRLLFFNRSSRSLRKAFILINIYATGVFLSFAINAFIID
jgi:protoheme IX farnesyltransferase